MCYRYVHRFTRGGICVIDMHIDLAEVACVIDMYIDLAEVVYVL